MEAASLPLATFRFLYPPPPAACCSRRNLSCVRAAPQALELEAQDASSFKPPRPSPRRNAVAVVKAAPDPVAALTRFEDVLQTQDCNIILRHYGDTRRWDDLSKVFGWMQEHEMLNFASYRSYLKYLGLNRNPARALQVYGAIKDQSTRVHASVCNSVLGCLVKNGKFESRFKIYDDMVLEGLSPDAFTYSTVRDYDPFFHLTFGLRKLFLLERCSFLFLNYFSCKAQLLSGCMKSKQGYTKAVELINELNFRGLQMDSVIYGTLLAICTSHNYCEEAGVYFRKMKDEGHNLNLFHYSSLLNAYSENVDYAMNC